MTCNYIMYYVTVTCNVMLAPNSKFKNKNKIKMKKEIRMIESTIFNSNIILVLNNSQISEIKIYL